MTARHNAPVLPTLYRSILLDLLRVGLITTIVLVTVIAFGAAIKPLARDSLLTAGQAAKYITLAIVPMLQFALPFAAGFAGTLALHRMSSENEILAAAATGISYPRLLAPILALGVGLMLLMLVLTQWVIPKFWGLLEETVARDVTKIFEATINRGEAFVVDDQLIYADKLTVEERPADTEADTRLILSRVAAAQLDDEGRISTDTTAHQAVVDIYRRPGRTYLKLVMSDAVIWRPEDGQLSGSERVAPARAIVLPNLLEDDPRGMTYRELQALRKDPTGFGPVAQAADELRLAIRTELLQRTADRMLRDEGAIELVTNRGDDRTFRVEAARLRGDRVIPERGERVRVLQLGSRGEVVREILAEEATLERRVMLPDAPLVFDLILRDCEVTVSIATADRTNVREVIPLEAVSFSRIEVGGLSDRGPEALKALAADRFDEAPRTVERAIEKIDREIRELRLEIRSRLQKRLAMSVTALLLLMLGATLAMWLRHSLPLVIYLWAFLPSIIDLILISSGDHLMRDGALLRGLLVMWSGNLGLLGVFIYAYVKLQRH